MRTRRSPASAREARPGRRRVSRILIAEIERPRSGPMRDIVATIQPDQDDIVRAGADQTVCVQGAPGTGKTAVGLHRIAYLLYAYPGRMTRGGVLVIGPNRAFLSYIRNVLPALGELNVSQATLADLLARCRCGPPTHRRRRGSRGHPDGRGAAPGAVGRAGRPPSRCCWPAGHGAGGCRASELGGLVAELRGRGVRYAAGRDMLGHRIAHVILTRMEAAGETCDDRTHDAVRRSRPVRAAVDAIWPKADPVRLVLRLLSDPALLARRRPAGCWTPAEQEAISWGTPARGPGVGAAGPRPTRCWSMRPAT